MKWQACAVAEEFHTASNGYTSVQSPLRTWDFFFPFFLKFSNATSWPVRDL